MPDAGPTYPRNLRSKERHLSMHSLMRLLEGRFPEPKMAVSVQRLLEYLNVFPTAVG